MANYKRGKCRRNCPKAIRGSQASWRARQGLKPVRIRVPDYTEIHRSDRALWGSAWAAWKRAWDHPEGRSMMRSSPAWWDRTFHTRPKRARARRLERQVLLGQIDEDDTVWPLASRKPTTYYW
jgi:hypothetical protein